MKDKKNTIARVDYHDFISGDPIKRANFIKEFGDSFVNMGFAIVENHGVSEDLKSDLLRISKAFFALDTAIKKKYELPNSGQRGFISKNRETAKGKKVPDLKEFYHIGQTVTDGDPIQKEYPENVWPEELPEFKDIGLEVYSTFEKTGRNLLRAIALYLKLPENYFDTKIHNGNSILRLLHYYPLDNVDHIPEGSVRAAAHGDINLITLLMGADVSGLQAQDLDGNWIDVDPGPNAIAINIGDMLERHTNGLLRSTIHQVINPTNLELLKKPRYSMPFFLHPRSDMDLSCLESCVPSGESKGWDDITAGDFLNERLLELGLKKK